MPTHINVSSAVGTALPLHLATDTRNNVIAKLELTSDRVASSLCSWAKVQGRKQIQTKQPSKIRSQSSKLNDYKAEQALKPS